MQLFLYFGILLQEVVSLRQQQVVLRDNTIIQPLLLVCNAKMQCGAVNCAQIVQYALNVSPVNLLYLNNSKFQYFLK